MAHGTDPPTLAPTPNPDSSRNWGTAPGDLFAAPSYVAMPEVAGYTIEAEIGRGGMGVVYRARDRAFDRTVALKVPHDHFSTDSSVLRRFLDEARLTGQLQHPGIPAAHTMGQLPDGRPYLVMQLIEGHTLNELLKREPGTHERFVEVFARACQAVAYAHAHRVVHRDLKPMNIMVGKFDRVLVMDWGLAKVLTGEPDTEPVETEGPEVVVSPRDADMATRAGSVMGTPAYMSPEQARGEGDLVDERADVFGLGATLCTILTGRPPYADGPLEGVLQMSARGETGECFARLAACGADPALIALCQRCLAPDREARPRNAGAVAQAVASYLEFVKKRAELDERRKGRAKGVFTRLKDWLTGTRYDAPALPAPLLAVLQPPAPVSAPRLAVIESRPPPASPSTPHRPQSRPADEAFSAQAVVLRYPAPIALPFRRFCARKDPNDRLGQLFSTFELTVRYLVYLAHADLARARVRKGPPYAPLPDHQGFDFTRRAVRMTLGQWLAALRAAAAELAKVPDRFLTELPEVCRAGGILGDKSETIDWLTDTRNAFAHPKAGRAFSAEKCTRLLPGARARLERVLQEIGFVRRYPLGFVVASPTSSDELRRYRVHSCMGSRVAHDAHTIEPAVPFPVGVPFVVSPDETAALCLWPFVQVRESDATQCPTLYMFEKIEDKARFLASVEVGAIDHEDTWSNRLNPTGAADHDWLWGELARLPQTIPLTPDLRLVEELTESHVGRLTGAEIGAKKHIRLSSPIARGGFGTVYDAFDAQRNIRVAVKVIEDRELDLTQFKRFKQEYEKLHQAGERMSGFIRTFEWGTNVIHGREYPWFSMEFATGGDLSARLEERRTTLRDRLPWNEPEVRATVIEEFRTIATAVAELHNTLNIVHRDIKPGNVLVLEGGELRLSDFGLVKDLGRRERPSTSFESISTSGPVLGTRNYMAPEQARGEKADKPADVYALGVLLAELATGWCPVPVTDAVADSPLKGDGRVLKLPKPLRELITRCTDLAPERRPAHAGDVLSEFEKVAKISD